MESPTPQPQASLHLEHLAADADDLVSMLNRHHDDGGDIHPEAIPKAEHLATSLRHVIDTLEHTDRPAMSVADVLQLLGVEPAPK